MRQVHPHEIKLNFIADTKNHWQEAVAKIRESAAPMVIHTPDPVVVNSYRQERTLRVAELDFHFLLRGMNWNIPMVQVISGVSILIKNVHQFEPKSIAYILNSLPRLKTLTWSIRPHADWELERHFYKHLQKTVHM
jgi:hypothetical protein